MVTDVRRVLPRSLGVGLVLLAMCGGPAHARPGGPTGGPSEDERAVVAVLEGRCLRCHGGTATKGGLSLATASEALQGGDSGPAIEPGKPEESLLLEKVSGDDPEMPQGEPPLSAEEIAALRDWIARGAAWPDGLVLKERGTGSGPWWAVQPLRRPDVPIVRARGRVETPIDGFVLAKLEEKGLGLRPEADRRTLARRLTYDLTGLPPTPAEVERFVEDRAPGAYERLVDRLLASPRYGERWGRHWLDVVHYGDTHGYDKDKRRPNAWPYRDYVIRAFNRDTPYGRFIEEQVAGDVLFPDDPRATIATGFVAAGPWDFVGHAELREGTVEKEKTRLLDRDDMLANTMSTFSSLTVHCARCHDHKFDPIPQEDYYRLQAVFAGVDRGDRPYADPAQARARAELEASRDALTDRLKVIGERIGALRGAELERLDADLATWQKELAALPGPSRPTPSQTNGYHSAIEAKPDATKWVQVDLGARVAIDEVRLIAARPVDYPDTPGFGFPLRFRVEASDGPDFQSPRVLSDVTEADAANPGDSWWIVRPEAGTTARTIRITATKLWPRTKDYVFALGEVQVISRGANVARSAIVTALDSIEAGRWSARHLVDGFDSRHRIDDPADAALVRQRCDLRYQIMRAEARRPSLLESLIPAPLRSERDALRAERASVEAAIAALPSAPQVYALTSHRPRPIHVLRRGDVQHPGKLVGPGALTCVPGLTKDFDGLVQEGDRRAALARWLSSKHNVLTWRSIANRVWLYHFGRGLVETPNDFGHNGAAPTHPELLDWLAVTLRDDLEGSLKGLHRLIVTSATYRQASTHDEAASAIDADNRLLWRQERRRLEAEAIRDAVLFVSGRLDERMGGPGYALFRFKDDHSPIYDHDDPEWIDPPEGRRRTVYRFVVRSVPNPFIECLDGADPNVNVPVRNTTITALQALALLNDPFMMAAAEAFGARLEGEADPIGRAFGLALGRAPRPSERRTLTDYAERHGLANACRLVFNLNEFLFVD